LADLILSKLDNSKIELILSELDNNDSTEDKENFLLAQTALQLPRDGH
jgi:hypothetical protein